MLFSLSIAKRHMWGYFMKLVSYNVQYGFGADGVYDLARIANVVKGADIVALQEVERNWGEQGWITSR